MNNNQLSALWLKAASALLAVSPIPFVLWFQDSLTPYIAQLPPVTVLRIILITLLTTTTMLALLIFQHPWLRWDERTGTWANRFSKTRYCANCNAKKNTVPLKSEVDGWRCMACHRWFADPSHMVEDKKTKIEKHTRI